MKIIEVIGSFAGQYPESVVPVGDWMQSLANAFTRTGQVKRPLDFQRINAHPALTLPPFSSISLPGEDIAATAEPAPPQSPAQGTQRSARGLICAARISK